MTELSKSAIEQALSQYSLEDLGADPVSAGVVEAIDLSEGQASVRLQLGYPCGKTQQALTESLTGHLQQSFPDARFEITCNQFVPPSTASTPVPGVKHVIAVASGKGGVGKSTTAVNIALALAAEGARVGLLDADIYGPSQPMMLGIPDGTRPEVVEEKYFRPVLAHGIQTMSIGYLVTEETPMVWRGPMASGALQQLLQQTLWQDVDYLIVDMPPGTGDIQLTLSQKASVAGSVIVTTPQDIALLDAQKGIEMFRKVSVPVLGIVENMATHICSQCGHEEPIFGAGGGDRIAKDYGVDLLGSLPLSLTIREQVDSGQPSVIAEPEGDVAQSYRHVARRMAANLWQAQAGAEQDFPEISVSDD